MAAVMTWRSVIAKAAAYLTARGVEESPLKSELLAARLLNVGRGLMAGKLETVVSEVHLAAMRRGLSRLAKGEPIQYVLGEWDFRTLTLKCDARALIPRPETEELVTLVLKYLRAEDHAGAGKVIVDVGTGTGAIILSLAREFAGRAAFIGTDVSEGAIALARENARRSGLEEKVKLVVADGLDDFDEPECVDVIVSNPPYIATAVCETLSPQVRDFEPRLALDGGSQGLDFYDRYLGDALNLLKPGGAVFFEIGNDQGAAVRDLMFGYGFNDIQITQDLAGLDRYASARLT